MLDQQSIPDQGRRRKALRKALLRELRVGTGPTTMLERMTLERAVQAQMLAEVAVGDDIVRAQNIARRALLDLRRMARPPRREPKRPARSIAEMEAGRIDG